MKDELKTLKAAVASLVEVAKAFHTPLDTSTVEKAIRAVERAAPSESKTEKSDKDDKDEKPSTGVAPTAPKIDNK